MIPSTRVSWPPALTPGMQPAAIGVVGPPIVVRSVTEDMPGDGRGFCHHDTPCGCYAERYAAGMAKSRAGRPGDTLEVIAKLRQVLDQFEAASG